jgi:putative transposase
LPVNTVVMGIAGSRRCSSEPAGRWAKTEWSVSPPHERRPVRGDPGIWRREGLKVPQKQKPRGRLWLNDGSCVRLRPMHRNHVWSYDFVSARTHDGRSVRLLNLIDEHTRESLLVRAQRRWSSSGVISALADVMVMKGVPEHLRSDNGPEFVAKDLRNWLANTGAKTLYIEPGSPWENGYCESFNSKLRDEFLNGEIFYSIKELRVLAERWRVHYNTIRPHSSLGYRSPAPEAWLINNTGHGEVETAMRFPLPHTPDGGYLKSETAALH